MVKHVPDTAIDLLASVPGGSTTEAEPTPPIAPPRSVKAMAEPGVVFLDEPEDEGRRFSLNLDANYGIDADDYNFTLVQRKTVMEGKRAGTEVRKAVGYYGRFGYALEAYTSKALGTADVKLISDLKREIARLDKTIRDVGAAFLARVPPKQSLSETTPDVRKKP